MQSFLFRAPARRSSVGDAHYSSVEPPRMYIFCFFAPDGQENPSNFAGSTSASGLAISSGSGEHALHGSEVISRRVLAFSLLPTSGVFLSPGSINVQFSDEPGNTSRKRQVPFSSARSKLRADVQPSAASSDVVGAPPDGGPNVRVFGEHWFTSTRWPPPVSFALTLRRLFDDR